MTAECASIDFIDARKRFQEFQLWSESPTGRGPTYDFSTTNKRKTKKMKMKVTKVKPSRWVDTSLSDCLVSGYREPSVVMLWTVEDIPVTHLPGAENNQYGHTVAKGWERMSLRSAMQLLKKDRIEVGDTVEVTPRDIFRNQEMRKMGTFRIYAER